MSLLRNTIIIFNILIHESFLLSIILSAIRTEQLTNDNNSEEFGNDIRCTHTAVSEDQSQNIIRTCHCCDCHGTWLRHKHVDELKLVGNTTTVRFVQIDKFTCRFTD